MHTPPQQRWERQHRAAAAAAAAAASQALTSSSSSSAADRCRCLLPLPDGDAHDEDLVFAPVEPLDLTHRAVGAFTAVCITVVAHEHVARQSLILFLLLLLLGRSRRRERGAAARSTRGGASAAPVREAKISLGHGRCRRMRPSPRRDVLHEHAPRFQFSRWWCGVCLGKA